MKNTLKKLRLDRQTIRQLGTCELARAGAGIRPDGSDRDMTCAICEPSMPTVCPL